MRANYQFKSQEKEEEKALQAEEAISKLDHISTAALLTKSIIKETQMAFQRARTLVQRSQ